MRVAEAGVFVHAIESAAEGREDRVFAVWPWPEPRSVNMRVADDVHDFALLIVWNGRDGRSCGGNAKHGCAAEKEIAPRELVRSFGQGPCLPSMQHYLP